MIPLMMSDEVKKAQNQGVAVVALESTIISHGMPFPDNVATAQRVEAQVRASGAVPATIAILDGVACIGLDQSQLHKLGKLGRQVSKCSRRDLAFVMANKLNGSTTVAATMFLAHKAGIQVFVTGGIGGVHRGVEHSMDISADLTELGRTPVTVVCAGVKSILDIRRTLEYLETQGVPVMTFRSEKFPAFFTPDSGEFSPLTVQSAEEAARIISSSMALGLQNGAIVAVPVPEQQAAQYDQVESASRSAIEEAEMKGVSGRDLTPFLLQRINELTGGESLKSNIALILNNAHVGATIAISLQSLRNGIAPQPKAHPTGRVIVVGGASEDIITACPSRLVLSTSNIGRIQRCFGGVGRNIAECIARLGVSVKLVGVVGDDHVANNILAHSRKIGIDVSDLIQCMGYSTSSYIGLHGSDGDLCVSVADFRVVELLSSTSSDIFKRAFDAVQTCLQSSTDTPMLVLDANLQADAIAAFVNIAYRNSTPIWIETISIEKASRLAKILPHLDRIDFISPNEDELIAIVTTLSALSSPQIRSLVADAVENFRKKDDTLKKKNLKKCGQIVLNLTSVKHLVCTRGRLGIMLMERVDGADSGMKCTEIEASKLEPERVVNTNGAGDCLVGGCVAALACGYSIYDALALASKVSAATVASSLPVADTLVPLKRVAKL